MFSSHVWVRTDLVESIIENGGDLPRGWKPRKRGRDSAHWGWCRANVISAGPPSARSPHRQANAADEITSPFGTVKLRSVKAPSTPSWAGSASSDPRRAKTIQITLVIDDLEFAPQLQNVTVTFTYNTGDFSKVCPANDWWFSSQRPPDDLTELEQLHEPATVYCLQRRYEEDEIYTYTGKILIALNPFRTLENLYGENVMQQYWSAEQSSHGQAPHVYATAYDAYRSMMISIQTTAKTQNQSILVSGESGAGKTVTTKIIMRFIATLSQRSHQSSQQQQRMEQQVLQSNPILESFGNARTVRNDNSSRFGKFIELQFNTTGSLVSAVVETYLLEKVRLLSQAQGERNYHVFYELLAGLPQRDRKVLFLSNRSAHDFAMTCQSGTFDRRDGVKDKDSFRDLLAAMNVVGFDSHAQNDLFTVVSALLHLSNLSFRDLSDASELDRSNPSLQPAISLLGVNFESLNDAACRCAIEARGEILHKNLNPMQAQKAVEALIKVTYEAMFQYIVCRINESIDVMHTTSDKLACIGVLDIFGFESFDVNSFEQLCINYCNEALQQQFNRFVFKLEQQEYQREGIEWSFISFPDNQDILDLIEKRREGILYILDEQCRLATCTDSTFARAVYDKCGNHERFEATKGQQALLTFSIHHYAGLVEYDSAYFLEKNKDELPKEAVLLLSSSSNPFLARLGEILAESQTQQSRERARNPTGSRRQLQRASSSIMRETVGSQFSTQLKELRSRIESTEPHYVRCIKPNDDLIPHHFDHLVIADQLRCAGVLEAIRVSRVGFPHRFYHEHFLQRYRLLARSRLARYRNTEPTELCEVLVELLVPQVSEVIESSGDTSPMKVVRGKEVIFLGMQMGKTKVFLRRKAFEALEHLRTRKLENAAALIQSCARMFFARSQFEVTIWATLVIQTFLRQVGAYRLLQKYRVQHATLVLQRAYRCFRARCHLFAAKWIAWWGQSMYRGAVARQYCAFLFLDLKISVIQRAWRRHRSCREFEKQLRVMKMDRMCSMIQRAWKRRKIGSSFRTLQWAVVSLQTRYRMRAARVELIELRRRARDLSLVAAERDKYRVELMSLRKELQDVKTAPQIPENKPGESELDKLRDEVERLRLELEKSHRMSTTSFSQEEEIALLVDELTQREDELEQLKREVVSLRSRDDSFSVKSFTVEGSPSGTYRSPIPSESPFRRLWGSPIRSDLSLLDAADDRSPHITSSSGKMATGMSPGLDRLLDSPLPAAPSLETNRGEWDLNDLHNAIRHGNRNLFDRVIQTSSRLCLLVNQGDQYGRTALHLAALSLRADMVEVLIIKGAVVNAQDDDGETPLHLAENAAVTEVLLKKGRANPNIPNVDGICAIHLAVQRRDIESVKALLRSGANVNNADNIRWFTPLHLIALPARHKADEKREDNKRQKIAQLLCSSHGPVKPDVDFQDSQANSPLHYAVQLVSRESCSLVDVFLDKGASPNLRNERNQSPLHLLCHNTELRRHGLLLKVLKSLLSHGADPNLQSLTGCTPVHLCLYHKDIDAAVELVSFGAELHIPWKKPKKWPSFWREIGSDVLALDMVEDEEDQIRVLSAITKPLKWAPTRSWCMSCKSVLGTFARAMHCRHCSRLICGVCSSSCLPAVYFPKNFDVKEPTWVCGVCEKILTGRREDASQGTPPTALSFGDEIPFQSSGEDLRTESHGNGGTISTYGDDEDAYLYDC